MSDLSDTPQSEGACPLPKRVEFAQWLLRFLDPDRSSDYRDAFWDLLRALLTQYQGDGKDGIEPSFLSTQDLWRWALDGRGKPFEDLTSEKARKRVNPHWSALEQSFAELQGRFTDAARKAGFTGLLWPTKDKSEGGRSSTYRLEWRPFGVSTALPTLPADYEKQPFVLRYREDRSSLRFSLLGRLFLWPLLFRRQGEASMRIDGIRRYVPAIGLGLMVLVTGLPVLVALMRVADGALEWELMVVAAIFFWFLLRPLIRLYDRFIIMASPLFYPFSEKECQIELVWDPEATVLPGRSRGYNLRLVRYVADCPLCGGNVSLREGGLGQFNRLVGCCDEEPGEHVFSFDRKLRAGYRRQSRW
ncbi:MULTISPECIES: hypothetical protein [Thauera]|jgi:hypothetical protein|uniref:hypothetical protein n=1 Tax=Thauera TaxID=33057 RepID=UPI002636DEB2|nr:hypothetical protein [Thauera sp.]MCP5225657.1 hypothetical protein [Thauera sp.]